MMHVIGLISSKGGTGKSTIATNLAVAAHLAGLKSCIIDLDSQGSSCEWADCRTVELPTVIDSNVPRLKRRIEQLRQENYEFCVVDTPGELTGDMLEGIDFVLVPTEDSYFSAQGASQTIRFITGKMDYAVLLNKVHHSANCQKLEAPLCEAGLVVAPTLRMRDEYKKSPQQGLGVQEYAPTSSAAKEVEALYQWVLSKLGVSSHV